MNRYRFTQYIITSILISLLTLLATACSDQRTTLEPPLSTNSPRPTKTSVPAPTLVPSDLTWFTPNMGSRDYPELFSKPEEWSVARSRIDIFKFYTQNVLKYPCPICGDNTLSTFIDVQAFQKLADWGIAIAVEVGAVKPWGYTSDVTFAVAKEVIGNVQTYGGTVTFLAMDEPRVGGEEIVDGLTCGYTMEESAEQTAGFIKLVRAAYPQIIVGDIQAYPHFSVTEIQEWILSLEDRGATPAFMHMDIDIERVRVEGRDVIGDLQALSQFFENHNIPFGVIFISNWRAAGSDRAYFDSTMEWVDTVNTAIGKPHHVIFQSWQGPAPSGQHEVPINLPENDPAIYSHTRLLLDGLAAFDSLSASPPDTEKPTAAPFTGIWEGTDPVDGSITTLVLVQTENSLTGTFKDTFSPNVQPPGYEGSGSGMINSTTTAQISFSLTRWDGNSAQAQYSLTLSNQNNTLTLSCDVGCPITLQRK